MLDFVLLFLAMAELKQALLCSFGLTKMFFISSMSLFYDIEYSIGQNLSFVYIESMLQLPNLLQNVLSNYIATILCGYFLG